MTIRPVAARRPVLVAGASLRDVPAPDWNALVEPDEPFLEHAFLLALETSGSVGSARGWTPHFVLAYDHDGNRDGDARRLVGAVPLYLKTDSYGEFIFDWSWANAALRGGIPYYPKLVAAVPFTPASGRRLLLAPGVDAAAVRGALIEGVARAADDTGASSVHFLFCTEDEKNALAAAAYHPRLSMQFHWTNRAPAPYESFDDYLGDFRSENRKQVRKERARAAGHGLDLRTVAGSDLTIAEWASLRTLYLANVVKHDGTAYLTARFFDIIRETFAHRLVATLASRGGGGDVVAGTVNFEKGRHLYGRYWGCLEENADLHFELCYYRLIERAIERGYTRFEAGAQGEHKLKRGLLPAFTHSAHWIRRPGLSRAIAGFVADEAAAVTDRARAYSAHSPFRSGRAEAI